MASSNPQGFDLRTICSVLGRVQTKCFKIGIQLGIPHNKLQEFEKESDPLSTVVNYWLSGNVTESVVPISWKTIVKALKSEHVGEPGLAEDICKEYCTQKVTTKVEATSNSSDEATSGTDDKIDPDIKEDLEFILEQNLRKICVTYACYVNTIRSILKERGVTPDDLIADLLTFPAFTKGQHLALLHDKETELKKCKTLSEIFTFLNKKCASFLDCEIFQDILNYYRITEDQERLKYSDHLECYAKKHKVLEFVKVNPLLKEYTKDSEKLVLKFDVEQTCRLAQVKNLKRVIAKILDLNPSTLQIIDIKEGCVVVTFLIPASVADIIFTPDTVFTPQQEDELQANSILRLEYNGRTFDFKQDKKVPADSKDHVTKTTGTAAQTKAELGGVEKVKKQLAEIFSAETYQSVTTPPLHSVVESCDTGNVRNLLKGTEIELQTSTVKPKPTETLVPKLLEKLSGYEGKELKKLGILKKITRNLYTDTNKFETISATPIHRATESHDMGKVKEVLGQAEYSVNCTDSIGWTPLHYACAVGNLDMVRMLVSEFNADVTVKDEQGITALMLASLAGHDSVVHTLLSEYQCPDPNAALFMACAGGHTSLVRTLILEHNADVHDNIYFGLSPLEMAAYSGNDEVMLTLIKQFGYFNKVKGHLGRTLLHQACIGGSVNLVRTLIREHSADVKARDAESNTPLHVAAFHGKDEVALTLLNEFGSNTKDKGRLGRTLLHQACIGGSVNLVRTLIREHNTDVKARDDENNTPLHVAAFYGKDEVVLTLINEFGCDINVKGQLGRSLLHQACFVGSINLVRTLIREHNADVNARDDQNNTPLQVAAFYDCDEVVVLLMTEFGCIPDNDDTPLHEAALCGNEEVVLALINKSSCDIKVKGPSGRSLLHMACYGGSVNLVRTLILEYNADVNARDDDNNTPLDVAAFCGHDEVVVTLMTEFGCQPSH